MKSSVSEKRMLQSVQRVLDDMPLVDIHTHLYDPAMGEILLWGIDELLTYHYLVAELFRANPELDYDAFWAMEKPDQADLIWNELFVKRSPLSEACRGVLTALDEVGLDPDDKNLARFRKFYQSQKIETYVNKVFKIANIKQVYMTNDPLDPQERPAWKKGFDRDPRFLGVLRLDSAVMNWPEPVPGLRALGYDVDEGLTGRTIGEIRRYLNEWSDRIAARYLAISLPPSFRYPDAHSPAVNLLTHAAFPVACERRIPVAMMIGVKKRVNPKLRLAGDSVGKADIDSIERIAAEFEGNRFLLTMLSRENVHELCIAARKFKNITPFGCWWFLNNPSLIKEITRLRLETLGLSFVPQHSDARVLDQLIYKWAHSRAILASVLAEKYSDVLRTGRWLNESDIRRDVGLLFDARL